MRIVALSDLHGILPPQDALPECDVLVLVGDVLPNLYKAPDEDNLEHQAIWMKFSLRPWLEQLPAKSIVAIAGNHDWIFQKAPDLIPEMPWTYLENSSAVINGVKFWGSPWTIRFLDWAYNAPESKLATIWDTIPVDTQILLTHQPPYGYGDFVDRDEVIGPDGKVYPGGNTGDKALLSCLEKLTDLQLHLFGHIHSGFGQWEYLDATLANVSLLNDAYRLVRDPVLFTIKE